MPALKYPAALVLLGWLALYDPIAIAWPQTLQPHELKYYQNMRRIVDMSPEELRKAYPELKKLEPASSQADLPQILEQVGKGVDALVRTLPNTVSKEEVQQERLGQDGSAHERKARAFSYLALARPDAVVPGINEFRTDDRGRALQPLAMKGMSLITIGFVSLPMHFHPQLQSGSAFLYLGNLTSKGRDLRIVAFAQRPEAAQATTQVAIGNRSGRLLVQGIARIDAKSYQIVEMRVDLLAPRPDVGIQRQTTEIRFGEVQFRQHSEAFWLPREVVVTVDREGYKFRNTHHYSQFKLFNVEAKEKDASSESTPQAPTEGK